MYRLGNPAQLSQKYGNVTPVATNLTKKTGNIARTTVNKNATFNRTTKITLPLEPSTLLKPVEQVNVTITKEHNVKGNTKLDLLNFIDVAKLKENRSGMKIKSYFLDDLKHLFKLMNIPFKNDNGKLFFLEKIRDEMDKVFNEDNNLISDLKLLNNDEAKQIKNIIKLFEQHDISEPTKTELLTKIKETIKEYRTTEDIIPIIIEVIERQWVEHKKKTKK